jgi:hypothetical protein
MRVPMSQAVAHKDRIFEDSSYVAAARITGAAGVNATQASLTSIAWTITETTGVVTPPTTGTLTIASVIFDTIQTSGWDGPLPGYNFRATFAPANWPTPGLTYVLEVIFTFTDGFIAHAVWELEVMALRRS